MSRTKKILVVLVALIGLLFLFGIWYQYTYSMDEAEAFQVNPTTYPQKLLIATQGSEFKNSISNTVIDHFKTDSVFINVVDISALKNIKPTDYNALLIVHTWENWKPPSEIKTFIDNNYNTYQNHMVVMTTSGEGSYKMIDVDAITGESKTENITPMATQAIERLEVILSK